MRRNIFGRLPQIRTQFDPSSNAREERKTYMLFHKFIATPVGELKIIASDQDLVALLWENDDPKRVPLEESALSADHPVLNQAAQQLHEYFGGKRQQFSLPLDMRGTAFQKSVWGALCTIPFGETISYGELARVIGNPAASRAVGAANGRNPVSIIVPCHRVIGATGKLTGFAGGLDAKQKLLSLESSSHAR